MFVHTRDWRDGGQEGGGVGIALPPWLVTVLSLPPLSDVRREGALEGGARRLVDSEGSQVRSPFTG